MKKKAVKGIQLVQILTVSWVLAILALVIGYTAYYLKEFFKSF